MEKELNRLTVGTSFAVEEKQKNRRTLELLEELGLCLGYGEHEALLLGQVNEVLAASILTVREERKTRAIMEEVAKVLGIHPEGGPARTASLALDHIRKTKRPTAAFHAETMSRLGKILEKTDAIRDDIAATIRLGGHF